MGNKAPAKQTVQKQILPKQDEKICFFDIHNQDKFNEQQSICSEEIEIFFKTTQNYYHDNFCDKYSDKFVTVTKSKGIIQVASPYNT